MLNVVDLYSGVGGLSLGAARAGCNLVGAVEIDPNALRSHQVNFPRVPHSAVSVSEHTANSIASFTGVNVHEIDGVIGGPPCQGFSSMGKRDELDERNNLFIEFFRLVNEIEPRFFVAENVPGVLSSKFDEIRNRAIDYVADKYEIILPFEVTASDYGVPTTRTRVLFVGYRREYVARLSESSFSPERNVTHVTVSQALGGLPLEIDPNWIHEVDGWRKIDRTVSEGPFFQKIYGDIPVGIGDHQCIDRLQVDDYVSGCLGTRHTQPVLKRFRELQPGETDRISKSVRLDGDGFCPTLRAGTGKDRGSFQSVRPIHPVEPRVITPREAARLQGFPDWFQFDRTKWHSFRQIGNSVSPILAEAILRIFDENTEH